MANIIEAGKRWLAKGKVIRRRGVAWPFIKCNERTQIVSGIGRGTIILDLEDLLAEDWEEADERDVRGER